MVKFVLAAVFLFVCTACATNPVSKQGELVLMSEAQELDLGRMMAAEAAKQLLLLPEDDPLVRYVNEIGQKVAEKSDRSDLVYRFHVVDDATINAFALPGGYIYIHRGLLVHLNSEAELAAVLGHEIGHVAARHAVQRYTQMQGYRIGMLIASVFMPMPAGIANLSDLVALAIIQGYGRKQELQADLLSLKYIRRAGYDARAAVNILKTLKRLEEIRKLEQKDAGEKVQEYHGAFASHPETEQRIREAAEQAQAGGKVGRLALLKAVEGYPYGDSPREGAVIGHRFIHPKLGIEIDFPDRWAIRNTPSALTARVKKAKVFFRMTVEDLVKREDVSKILEKRLPKRRTGPIESGMRHGLPYAHAISDMSAPHVSRARVHANAWIVDNRIYYAFMWCKQEEFAQYRSDFERIAASFRRYDPKRDGSVPYIRLYTWKAGDSWKALAHGLGNALGPFTAQRLAALNGYDFQQTPQPGDVIKLIR